MTNMKIFLILGGIKYFINFYILFKYSKNALSLKKTIIIKIINNKIKIGVNLIIFRDT